MKIIGMFFLLIGVGLLGTSVLGGFNTELDTGQVFVRGMAGIICSVVGGYFAVDSLKSGR